MNRRKFMQLCGLTIGGSVMGVGKAVIKDSQQGWSIARLCSQGIAQPCKCQFTMRMTGPQWRAMQSICGIVYLVGHDGLRYIYSNEENTSNEH